MLLSLLWLDKQRIPTADGEVLYNSHNSCSYTPTLLPYNQLHWKPYYIPLWALEGLNKDLYSLPNVLKCLNGTCIYMCLCVCTCVCVYMKWCSQVCTVYCILCNQQLPSSLSCVHSGFATLKNSSSNRSFSTSISPPQLTKSYFDFCKVGITKRLHHIEWYTQRKM